MENSAVTSDEGLDSLVPYRFYFRLNIGPIQAQQSKKCTHKMFKSINLTTRDQKFSGEDSCLILDFLTQVGEEVDTLGLSEGQIIV